MLAHLRLMPHIEVERKLKEMTQHRWRFVFKVSPPSLRLRGAELLHEAVCGSQDHLTSPPNAVNSLVHGICTGKSAT